MGKFIIFISAILLISCMDRQDKSSRYTEEQISSLHLDSTKRLRIETDSIINVDLNSFLKKRIMI